MFTSYSCFLSLLFLLRERYIFMRVGGERMLEGEFLFSEKGDGVISLTFIAVEISVTPFPLLMY